LSLTSSYRGEKLQAKTTGRLVSGVRNTGRDIEFKKMPLAANPRWALPLAGLYFKLLDLIK